MKEDLTVPGRKLNSRANETKKLIFETAIKMIKEKGYNNVTVNDICKQCGVTKGAFYYHFETKEAIIGKAYVESDAYVIKHLAKIFETEDSLDQFLHIILLYAEKVEDKGVEIMKQLFRYYFEPVGSNDKRKDFYNPEKRPLLELYASLFKKLQNTGKARPDVSFEYFFRNLVITFDGVLLDWCYSNGNYNLQEAVKDAISRYLYFFKTPDCKEPLPKIKEDIWK